MPLSKRWLWLAVLPLIGSAPLGAVEGKINGDRDQKDMELIKGWNGEEDLNPSAVAFTVQTETAPNGGSSPSPPSSGAAAPPSSSAPP